jgi:hypothetical protein
MTKPSASRKSDWPIIAGVVAVLLAVAGAYVGGYFALGLPHPGFADRVFPNELTYDIYKPAVWAESFATGRHVVAGHEGPHRGRP